MAVSAGSAQAAQACQPGHCYSQAGFPVASGYYMLGDYMSINASCLSVARPASEFVDSETWVFTGNSTNPTYWVEAGLLTGEPESSPRLFWADSRPVDGGAINVHFSGAASTRTTYAFDIDSGSKTSSTWNIDLGNYSGTSINNPGPSRFIQAGNETMATAATDAHVEANYTGMGFWNGSNNPSGNGWSYSQGQLYNDTIPSGYGALNIVSTSHITAGQNNC